MVITTIKAIGPLDPNITTATNTPIVAGMDKPISINGFQKFLIKFEYALEKTSTLATTNATRNPVIERLKVRYAL